MAKKQDEQLLTDWFGPDVKPVREGVYETKVYEEFQGFARWDGFVWAPIGRTPAIAQGLGYTSLADQNKSWRGRRCWVLTGQNELMNHIAGQPVDWYLVSARPGFAKWGGLAGARPFKSQHAAERFAARYPRLGLKAVLP